MELAPGSKPSLAGYLVGAYLFCVPAFGYTDAFGLLVIPQVLGALIVGYALVDLVGRFKIRIPLEIGLFALLGLWAALTHFTGPRADEGMTPGLGTFLKVVATTLACAQLIRTDEDLFAALRVFVFSILFVFAQNVGEIQYLRMAGDITEDDRFAGTLSNANTAAIFALTVIWACLVLLLRARRSLPKILLYGLPVGVSLVILYYSGSKKGFIGLALFVLFVSRLMYKRENLTPLKKGLIAIAAAMLIIVSGYFIYVSPFFFRMQQLLAGITTVSDSNRLELATEAIRFWLASPKNVLIGGGYDTFAGFSALGTYSHSTPLELLAGCGLVGLGLFTAFIWLLFRRFIRLYRSAADAAAKRLYFAIDIFLFIFVFFMIAAVLHDSRELLPVLGALAGFGRHQSEAAPLEQAAGALEAPG